MLYLAKEGVEIAVPGKFHIARSLNEFHNTSCSLVYPKTISNFFGASNVIGCQNKACWYDSAQERFWFTQSVHLHIFTAVPCEIALASAWIWKFYCVRHNHPCNRISVWGCSSHIIYDYFHCPLSDTRHLPITTNN